MRQAPHFGARPHGRAAIALRGLERALRREIFLRAAPGWRGTKAALKHAISRFLKPLRRKLGFLRRAALDRRLAALLAGLFLSGLAAPAAAIELSTIAAGTGGFVIDGIDANDRSGISLAWAGDVNGDGLADVIVAADLADPGGRIEAGESYVVFGKADGTAVDLAAVSAGAGGFVINGIDPSDYSGRPVSSAGDVNGDGLSDLIVAAVFADPGGDSAAGESYVIFGKADGAAVELASVALGVGGFLISGIDPGDVSGASVSGAGDVNGDGFSDLIVGAPQAESSGGDGNGESYVVFGKANGAPVELSAVSLGFGGFVIRGVDDYDYSGRRVAGAGDVNGDGLSDLIVAAPVASPGGITNAGQCFVIFGKADGTAVELSSVAAGTGGFAINGAAPSDLAGSDLSPAGDVNGDGLGDVIIGVEDADPGGDNYAGAAYVVFGKADGTAVELSAVITGAGGFAINGINAFDRTGVSASQAGDVNGDGLSDLVVGASSADPAAVDRAGASYVVYGKADGVGVELSAVALGFGGFPLNGIDADDYSGFCVSGGGDVNGDGLPDIAVSAIGGDPGGDSVAGESYVIFSPSAGAAAATYRMTTLAGDGAGGFVAPVTDFGDAARAKIDFSDSDTGSGAGLNGASNETVTITRSGAGISNLADAADVVWELGSDRTGFDSARVTFKYLDSESAGVPGGEGFLRLFNAPALEGPWTELATTRAPGRNELSATVTEFGFFAIARGTDLIPPIDLAGVAGGDGGFIMNGIGTFDRSGLHVSGAGDVNGDGLADVAVGAYVAGNDNAGDTYVVFGKSDGTAVALSAVVGGAGGYVIDGADAGDTAGQGVSGAGDVNGDGLADVILGASGADPGGDSNAGESYVVFGKTDGAAISLADLFSGTGGYVINGIDVNDYSGSAASGAGDVNGDGIPDAIIGADRADPGGDSSAGESYVVFGKSGGAAVDLSAVTAGSGGFAILGIDASDRSGGSVSDAGDVNGDGLADLIVGAQMADPGGDSAAGETYVVFGKADGTAVDLAAVAAGTGGFAINGIDVNDYSGGSVSSAGDVNGDGLGDLIVGAAYADPGGVNRAGETYVIFGKADGTVVDLAAIAGGAGGFVINGLDPLDGAGAAVASAGDVNGDGMADLIVGAPYADPGGEDAAGEGYVIFGKADGAAVSIAQFALGIRGFMILGIDADDNWGAGVASAGDVNGDGLSDVILGAPFADPGGYSYAGETCVVFSPAAPAASGTYRMKTAAGDGAGGFAAPVTDFGDVARVKIDFSDDDNASGGGLNGASNETVTITRSGASISNLENHADVLWQITSDRAGFGSAEVALKYLESEVASLGDESGLAIFKAAAPSGPWSMLETTRLAGRNELRATVASFSFFTIAVAPPNSAGGWEAYE